MDVFVVIGSYGEYAGKVSFVSGVYTDLAEAEWAVSNWRLRRKRWKDWHGSWCAIRGKTVDLWRPPTSEEEAAIKARIRPEPPYEAADEVEIIKIPLNNWLSREAEPIFYATVNEIELA